jgi:uncharacterized Zn finger protein (UPF0148 family)
MDRCSKHAESQAVGKCLSCGRYLCDECIAQKKGGKVLCYDCAVKMTLDEFDDREKRDEVVAAVRRHEAKKEAKKDARKGPRSITVFIIVGVIIIALQGGVIMADYLVRNRGETSFIWSNFIEMRYKRDLCADNLHRLARAVEIYKKDHGGSLPADPDGLISGSVDSVLTCPATGNPYSYAVRGDSYTLSCPSPEAHGLIFLTDEDGKLKWRKAEE